MFWTNLNEWRIYLSEYHRKGERSLYIRRQFPFALNELKLTWNVDYYILYRMRGAQIVAAEIKKVIIWVNINQTPEQTLTNSAYTFQSI